MLAWSGANDDQFLERFEWDGFFRVIRRIRAQKHRLTDGISGIGHGEIIARYETSSKSLTDLHSEN